MPTSWRRLQANMLLAAAHLLGPLCGLLGITPGRGAG